MYVWSSARNCIHAVHYHVLTLWRPVFDIRALWHSTSWVSERVNTERLGARMSKSALLKCTSADCRLANRFIIIAKWWIETGSSCTKTSGVWCLRLCVLSLMIFSLLSWSRIRSRPLPRRHVVWNRKTTSLCLWSCRSCIGRGAWAKNVTMWNLCEHRPH